MKTTARLGGILAVLIAILVLGAPSTMYAQLVQKFPTGKVDWEEGYVYGKAIGGVDMTRMKGRVHAEQVARKTARDLAYGALSETINGISIDATSIYQDELMKDDILRVHTKGVVRNAHVFKEEFSWLPGGEPRAVVIVRVPIKGGLSRAAARWAERQEEIVPPLPRFEAKAEPVEEKYTGLIIDAGGMGVRPVMVPKILTSDGQAEVYGPRVVDPNISIIMGFAGYAKSVEMAKKNQRIGSNPLVVKAQRADGINGGNIVVSEDDAVKILAADIRSKFLKDCKVVIVVNSSMAGTSFARDLTEGTRTQNYTRTKTENDKNFLFGKGTFSNPNVPEDKAIDAAILRAEDDLLKKVVVYVSSEAIYRNRILTRDEVVLCAKGALRNPIVISVRYKKELQKASAIVKVHKDNIRSLNCLRELSQ